ncbi:hypothetical protein L915_13314 [Phytophthora nicotianae]|uniref:Uncharacterized protein n=1 Tax=Phytophthora nicotianae TaxID=4792 RepID=W2GFW3_PHYNI|nr:hypothetical protein L915_13314 [Phytophthora nicotianae]
MAPDVVINSEYGPEAIMQHWCFMDWFGDVNVELKRWEATDGESLLGITTTSVTITKHTLRNVFPHLCTTDNSDRNSKLADQLLNQRLVMRGSTCFEWDDSTSRMTRVVSQSDMLSPMLQLLNSVEGVFRVFEQALILQNSSGSRRCITMLFLCDAVRTIHQSLNFIGRTGRLECGQSNRLENRCESDQLGSPRSSSIV